MAFYPSLSGSKNGEECKNKQKECSLRPSSSYSNMCCAHTPTALVLLCTRVGEPSYVCEQKLKGD